jgi:ATP citrate (pro-S)-lyase
MSAKPIREYDGKHLLAYWLQKRSKAFNADTKMCTVDFKSADKAHVEEVLAKCEAAHPWLKTTNLVCKPDQLIKRRGKLGLLGINLDWEAVKKWISARAGTVIKVYYD